MANKIRGITVQLGGDTSGLTKALAQADKALSSTQKELNAVQKGLKLDPNNTVLLAQKQDLLKNAISETSSKLRVLQENQEKVNKAFAANDEWEKRYAPLKEQIDAAKTSLAALKEKQAETKKAFEEGKISQEQYDEVKQSVKDAKQALSDLEEQKKQLESEFENGHINAEQYREYQREVENTRSQLSQFRGELSELGTSVEEADKDLDDAAEGAKNLGDETEKAAKKTEEAKSKISDFKDHASTAFKDVVKAAAAVTAAVLAVGKQAVETGVEFDKGMSQVAATMGYTWEELSDGSSEASQTFETLRGFALEMGKNTAFSASQASEALNYMALAGYDAETSIAMLPNTLNLAAAGTMELGTASDMVTDTQTALGLSIEETSALVDKMAKTASKSNTSVSQLGSAMLTIGATARDMAGGTTELSASLGILADNGIKGSEGGTKLRNIILALQSPTDKAAMELEKLGVNAYDSNGQFRPLRDTLADLDGALSEMSEQDAAIAKSTIFSKRDLAAVNALLSTNAARWNELTYEIDNSAGAAQEMADVQLDNLAGDITLLQSALEGAEITVSDKLTPSLRKAVQFGTTAVTELSDAFGTGGLSGAVEAAHQLIEREFGEQAKLIFGAEAAVKALTAAFVTYKAAMLLSEGIAALKSVNVLLAEGKTLTEALNAASLANPYVIIAAAAIAAGVAIKSVIDTQTDLIDETVSGYDKMNERQQKFVDGVNELSRSISESRSAYKDSTAAAEEQAEKYQSLVKTLYELDEAENLSLSDKEKMKAIVSELNSSIDGLNIELDEQTGHLITQKSTVDALVASYKRQAQQAVLQSRYIELYDQQIDAEKNLKQATLERQSAYNTLSDLEMSLFDMQKERNELYKKSVNEYGLNEEDQARYQELTASINETTQAISDQKDAIGDINSAYTSASETSKSLKAEMAELDEKAHETGTQLKTAAEDTENALDDLAETAEEDGEKVAQSFDVSEEIQTAVDEIESIISDYDDKLSSRTNTLQNWFDSNTTVKSDDLTFAELDNALGQTQRDLEDWANGISELADKGISKGLLQELEDAGPASADKVKALLSASQPELDRYSAAWEQTYNKLPTVAENQLSELKKENEKQIKEILKNAEDKSPEFKETFEGLGIDAADGYIEGLRGKLDEVKAIAKEMAETAAEATQEEQDSDSPAKVTRALGGDYGDGYVLGIEDKIKAAVKASQKLVEETVGAAGKAADSSKIKVPEPDFSAANKAVRGVGNVQSQQSANNSVTNVTYNFNQTNNSPKALGRWDIRRDTKNLLSMAGEV